MRAETIKIHNFRTFDDAEFIVNPYTLFIGANNAGKSNLIDAIRVFYEKDIKFDESRDFPKFPTSDQESWIEIKFRPSIQELAALKTEYKSPDNTFLVRKYLLTNEKDDDNKSKSGGIFAYINGQISNSRFYGAKNVQQGKFGEVIYIPAVSKLDDHTRLTGPSALRDLLNSVLKKVVDTSPSYKELVTAFETFGSNIKSEETQEGTSLQKIENDISQELEEWSTSFELFLNPVAADEIVKSLIGHRIQDKVLGQSMDPRCFGQGFQRHLIFTLIKLSSRYSAPLKSPNQKEFSPELTWILFEEPEAFLHPSQIEVMDASLRTITENESTQIIISTHNPEFVSLNIEDLPSLIRICRSGQSSSVSQIDQDTLNSIISENQRDLESWKASGIGINDDDLQMDMECLKYALWLDSRRCGVFFANKVLLVEGATETALFRYLYDKKMISHPPGGVFFFDTLGKYNIHRFMNLLGELKIQHSILYDGDNGKNPAIDLTIHSSENQYTIGIDCFPIDLEEFLCIQHADKPHRKPQHVMFCINQNKVKPEKLVELANKINKLLLMN